jgi:hypothetical protein
MKLRALFSKSSTGVGDLSRQWLASDWTWDVVGVAGSIAALILYYLMRESRHHPLTVVANAAADASVPLLVVVLVRYWYRYRRPGDTFCRVVDAFNHPDVVHGLSEYLGDQMLSAAAEVKAILRPEGADLGGRGYDIATYLILWLSRARLPKEHKCYRGVFVGPFSESWPQWEEARSFRLAEMVTKTTLQAAFLELATAVGRAPMQHRRVVVLSEDEFLSFLNGSGNAFLTFVRWHAEVFAGALELPLRILIFREQDDLARRFKEWCGGYDLVDYGIIGSCYVFGNAPNGLKGLDKNVKLICRTSEVLKYQERFEALWLKCDAAFSLELSRFQGSEDAVAYLKTQESQDNWPFVVKGIMEREVFFEPKPLAAVANS